MSGARFTATFALNFLEKGAATHLNVLRKTQKAEAQVAAATKRAATASLSAAKAAGTQTTAQQALVQAQRASASANLAAAKATGVERAALAAKAKQTEVALRAAERAVAAERAQAAATADATKATTAHTTAQTASTKATAAAASAATTATKASASAAAAARAQATALSQQGSALLASAAAMKTTDAASAKLQRETYQAGKAALSAAKAMGAQAAAADRLAEESNDAARAERGRAAATTQANAAAQRHGKIIGGAAATLGRATARAVKFTAAVGSAGVAYGLYTSVKAAGNFDTALREVGAVSETSGAKLQAMGKIARRLGLETGVGATAATQAMGELAKAGLQAAQIGPALKGTLQLAQAGGLGAAEAAEATANALGAFNLEAGKATTIADAYANAANLTTADVGDFALAMSQGASAAKTAGLSFEDTTLALTLLAKGSVKGSDAGTSLKAAITQLASPTKAAQGMMEEYGLSFFDAAGNMKSVSEISGMLNTKLGKLTREQRLQALTTLAGTDGQRALGAMMGVTSKEAEKLRSQLLKQGSAAQTARAKQGGYAGAMARLKASFEEIKIAIGTPLVSALAKAGDALSKFLNKLSAKGVFEKFGAGVSSVIGAATGKVKVQGGRVADPKLAGPARPGQGPMTREATGAEKAGAAIRKGVSAVSTGVQAAAKAAADAFTKLRPQITGFIKDVGPFWNGVLKPFLIGFGKGLLDTAKVILTVGVVAFRVLGKVLGTIGKVAQALGLEKVFKALGVVVSWFAGGPIAKAIGAAIKGTTTFGRLSKVVSLIAAPFKAAGKAGLTAGKTLLRVAGWIADKAIWPYKTLGNVALSMASRVIGAVLRVVRGVAGFVRDIGKHIGNAINWFKRLPSRAGSALNSLIERIGGVAGRLAKKGAELGKAIVSGIIKAIREAPGAVAGAIGSLASGAWEKAKGEGVPFVPGVRTGGRVGGDGQIQRFAAGGVVAAVSSGEALRYPNGEWATVPGPRVAADNVLTVLPRDTEVYTEHGQGLLAAGYGRAAALAAQLPHFAKGGVVRGKVSWFGGPNDGMDSGKTALGLTTSTPGVAIRPGATWQTGRPYLGGYWRTTLNGRTAVLRQTDLGPNQSTGRRIDYTYSALPKIGYSQRNFPTDDIGTATYLGKGAQAAKGKATGAARINADGSRTTIADIAASKYREGLMDRGAAARAGYDAALAGDTFKGYRKHGDSFLRDLRSAFNDRYQAGVKRIEPKSKSITDAYGTVGNIKAGGGWAGSQSIVTKLVTGMSKITSRKRAANHPLSRSNPSSDHNEANTNAYAVDISPGSDSQFQTIAKRAGVPARKGSWNQFNHKPVRGYRTQILWHAPDGSHTDHIHVGAKKLRTGGVARFRAGGTAGRRTPAARKPQGATATIRAAALGQGFERISDLIGRYTTSQLAVVYAKLQAEAKKGGDRKMVLRLQAALDQIDRRIGFRVGRLARAAKDAQKRIDRRATTMDLTFRKYGVDPASTGGVQIQRDTLRDDQLDLSAQRSRVTQALKAANKLGPRGKEIATELRSRLEEIRGAIAEAAVRQVELTRDAVTAETARREQQADWTMRLQGIDQASPAGVAIQQQLAAEEQQRQERLLATLRTQRAAALAEGKRGKAKLPYIEAAISAAGDAVTEAIVRQAELARDAVTAAVNQRSEWAQGLTDRVTANNAFLEASQRVARTSDTPQGMLDRVLGTQQLAASLARQADVEFANAHAFGSQGRYAEAEAALTRRAQLLADSMNAAADAAELYRAAQMKAVTDRIEATNFDASMADLIGERYQIQARLDGHGDASLAAQRAEYFETTVLPLLRRQEADLVAAVQAAQANGETEAERQFRLELEQKRNEILERQLQVQEDIKSNTADRSFGGSLAYEFGGGVYTDLVLDGNGA